MTESQTINMENVESMSPEDGDPTMILAIGIIALILVFVCKIYEYWS